MLSKFIVFVCLGSVRRLLNLPSRDIVEINPDKYKKYEVGVIVCVTCNIFFVVCIDLYICKL